MPIYAGVAFHVLRTRTSGKWQLHDCLKTIPLPKHLTSVRISCFQLFASSLPKTWRWHGKITSIAIKWHIKMSLHKTILKMRFKFWYSLLKKALPSCDSSVGGNSNAISPPPTQRLPFASFGETTPHFNSQCESGPTWKLLPTEFIRRCKQHVPDFQTEKSPRLKLNLHKNPKVSIWSHLLQRNS